MLFIIGEYECKIDDKGRIKFPSPWVKKLDNDNLRRFVINKGMDDCLTIYPLNEWEKVMTKVATLSDFKAEEREFKRRFYGGAMEIELDSADRLLIPKRLASAINLQQELMLFAHEGKIELWDLNKYNKQYRDATYDLDSNAEKLLYKKTE
jgi:MraZ protein